MARLFVVALLLVLVACGEAVGGASGGASAGQATATPGSVSVAPQCAPEAPDCDDTVASGEGSPGAAGSGEVLCLGPDEPAPDAPEGTDCSMSQEPMQAEPTTPRPGMANLRPVAWERVEANGRRLTILYWSGVEPCYVLDSVEVDETDTTVTVTLLEGSDPAEPDAMCIEIAKARSTTVRLSQPLGDRKVVDGADSASE